MEAKDLLRGLISIVLGFFAAVFAIGIVGFFLSPYSSIAETGEKQLPSWSIFVLLPAVLLAIIGTKKLIDHVATHFEKMFSKSNAENQIAFTDAETVPDNPAKRKKKTLEQPSIDYLRLIAQDEEDWRREQSGLKPIEYELKRIEGMDGTMFEHWCVGLLLRSGFQKAERTGKSGDQGVDIVAVKDSIRYAIQCKCYSSPLGNTPVQEVLGGKAMYNCHVGVVITNSTYTAGAVDLAQKHGILLWDRETLREMMYREMK